MLRTYAKFDAIDARNGRNWFDDIHMYYTRFTSLIRIKARADAYWSQPGILVGSEVWTAENSAWIDKDRTA